MSTSNEVARAYAAWTEAHKELIEAEQQLAEFEPDSSNPAKEGARRRVVALRLASEQLLSLADEVLRQHESEHAANK